MEEEFIGDYESARLEIVSMGGREERTSCSS